MKKLLLVLTALILMIIMTVAILFFRGEELSEIGKENTNWLVINMWNGDYFKPDNTNLSELDKVFIDSTIPHKYTENLKNKIATSICKESTEECATKALSAANLLISEGELEKATVLESFALKYYTESETCPIRHEITTVRHLIALFKISKKNRTEEAADKLVEKIRDSGGTMNNLKTIDCNILADQNPLLFHRYVTAVSDLMSYGSWPWRVSSSYIKVSDESPRKIKAP